MILAVLILINLVSIYIMWNWMIMYTDVNRVNPTRPYMGADVKLMMRPVVNILNDILYNV